MKVGKERLNCLQNKTMSTRVGGAKSLKCLKLISFVIECIILKSKH